jgi:hypothetical protein
MKNSGFFVEITLIKMNEITKKYIIFTSKIKNSKHGI